MAFNKITNLLDAPKDERRRFLDSFDLILSDCDGTIWNLYDTIEGVDAGVQALQAMGKRIVYVSNNSTSSAEMYEEKFADSGIQATFDDVLNPGKAVIEYLKNNNFDGLIYVIGSQNLKRLIEKAGYEVFDGPKKLIEETFSSLLQAVCDERPVRAVIFDWDYNLSVKQIIKACVYLRNDDCELYACATDMVAPHNIPICGPGQFLKIVEQMSGRTAIVLGKPGKPLKDIVLNKYGVIEPGRVLFVGDSLEVDVGFGKLCGFQTLAVLTGTATRVSIATHTDQNEVPDYFLASFADFSAVLKDL